MALDTLQRILLVEDEPDIRAVAQLALELVGGFAVKICASGQEALAEAAGFRPDLIVLDVMMPGMDGPTTFERLREQPELGSVPVVFLTAKAQQREITLLKSLGAIDVIAKPFDPMKLSGQMREIWEEWRGR